MTNHVIIGAGEAGLRAAAGLRDAGETRITLIGGEAVPSYERPALSKPHPEDGFHRSIQVDLAGVDARNGSVASSIDRLARIVLLDNGERLPFDRLLLATGATPRRLSIDPDSAALTLRTIGDARSIYGAARAGAHAVIIGAGLIGLEMAAELCKRGMEVTVLEAGPRALGRAVPADVAEVIADRHRQEGTRLCFDQKIALIRPGIIILNDGPEIAADLIVSAIGVDPDIALAESAGLACANGILVNAQLATSDPDIFAAGDCTALDHPRYGRMRFETWRNAFDQGSFAARAMMGATEKFEALPWFWSDHFDLGLQSVGLHDPARTVVRRDLPEGGWIRFEVDSLGVLHAATGIGPGNSVVRDIRLAERLIEKRAVVPPDMLADGGANLKAALKAA